MTALGVALILVCGIPLLGAVLYAIIGVVADAIRGDEGARAGLAMLGLFALCIGLSVGIALVAP